MFAPKQALRAGLAQQSGCKRLVTQDHLVLHDEMISLPPLVSVHITSRKCSSVLVTWPDNLFVSSPGRRKGEQVALSHGMFDLTVRADAMQLPQLARVSLLGSLESIHLGPPPSSYVAELILTRLSCSDRPGKCARQASARWLQCAVQMPPEA